MSKRKMGTILVGDSGVGKTSLLVQFDQGKFIAGSFTSTVGIGFTVSPLFMSTAHPTHSVFVLAHSYFCLARPCVCVCVSIYMCMLSLPPPPTSLSR
uniref:RAB26, member RAS oncogene family n=1 Tax=Oreochromis aureus TaxID=47969 RepID=A0AAZ1Y3K6_OREAU